MPKAVKANQGMGQRGRQKPFPKDSARALKYAKWINSMNEHEDCPGQSLATRNHEVIKHWAEDRKAEPATIHGTEHENRPGVLRFDFPGYGGQELEKIDWSNWFKSFDDRDLVFLFQEHLKSGKPSNFFKLDNPRREDG
ncbi:MAG: hypothetical protein AB1650_06575 [Candidatus Omnitrophota bacterium]